MKKAEAISILATSVRPREAKDRARYDEAVKMAIEALKSSEQTAESAQNTSSCAHENDLISRQAAIDCVTYDVEHTIECLKALPSVQPERKRGEWKPIGWSGRIHKCNQCGNMLDFGGVNAGRGDANFCPNCGADMREENES